jgi:hypothetical protein
MLENCFCYLNHFPDLEKEICQAGINAPFPEVPKIETADTPSPRSIVSSSRFFKTKFCQDLSAEFGQIRTNFIKNGPMTVYDWHRDLDRKVAINFLLNESPNSLVLFRDKEYGVDRMRYNIKVCEYTPRKPVIFNTTIQHTVINYDSQPRFILSLIFPMEVDYFAVKNFLEQYPTPKSFI